MNVRIYIFASSKNNFLHAQYSIQWLHTLLKFHIKVSCKKIPIHKLCAQRICIQIKNGYFSIIKLVANPCQPHIGGKVLNFPFRVGTNYVFGAKQIFIFFFFNEYTLFIHRTKSIIKSRNTLCFLNRRHIMFSIKCCLVKKLTQFYLQIQTIFVTQHDFFFIKYIFYPIKQTTIFYNVITIFTYLHHLQYF